jgi:hypothetical protein
MDALWSWLSQEFLFDLPLWIWLAAMLVITFAWFRGLSGGG